MTVWAVVKLYQVGDGDCGDLWADEVVALYSSETKAINAQEMMNAGKENPAHTVEQYEVL